MSEGIIKKESQKYEKSANALMKQIGKLEVIDSDEKYQKAAVLSVELKGIMDIIEERKEHFRKPAFDSYQRIMDQFKEMNAPYVHMKGILDEKTKVYLREKLKKEEEDRRRAEEKARVEEEKEKEKMRKQSEKLKKKGMDDEALELELEAETYTAPMEYSKQKQKTEVNGGSMTYKKKMICVISPLVEDQKKILQEVIDGNLPIGCVEIKPNKILNHAKENKISIGKYPGYILKNDVDLSTSAGKK